MGYKLLTEDQPLEVESIVALIYGEPGIGKSSVAMTAESPVLEDYDGGAQRAVNRKTILRVDKWTDAVEFHKSGDLEENQFKSIIIDTAGTMLDNYMADYCISANEKNSKSGGGLSLQGYGALKETFNSFVKEMKMKKIDIIFICHAEEVKEGDETKFKPKVTGGSYDILLSVADMVGYMRSINNKRTIDFNPRDRHVGKNTAEFDVLNIPHYTDQDYARFFARLIEETKNKMVEQSEAQKKALETIKNIKKKIRQSDFDGLYDIYKEIVKMEQVFQTQLLKVWDEHFVALYQRNFDELKSSAEAYTKALNDLNSDAENKNFPKRLLRVVKLKLWETSKENGFGFDDEKKVFIKTNKDNSGKKSNSAKEGSQKPQEAADGKKKSSGKGGEEKSGKPGNKSQTQEIPLN